MYERFTDRARKVMQLANQEAQRFRHEYIGTEHILLGLTKEGSGVATNVLKNLNIDLRVVRLEVEKIVQTGPGEDVVIGKLPHTPRTRKVIEYSVEEAQNLNHNYVGTEHLLLGLLRVEEGVAAQVLMRLGTTLEIVRQETLDLLGHFDKRRNHFSQTASLTPEEIVAFRALIARPAVVRFESKEFTPEDKEALQKALEAQAQQPMALMPSQPTIRAAVSKLSVQPGDVLVFRSSEPMTEKDRRLLIDGLGQMFDPALRISYIFIPPEETLTVMRQGQPVEPEADAAVEVEVPKI